MSTIQVQAFKIRTDSTTTAGVIYKGIANDGNADANAKMSIGRII